MNNSVSLLPTARVQVQCKDGSWRPKTLLFDSGADRSYVTKSLVKEVSQQFIRSTNVSFATFGGSTQSVRSREQEICLKDMNESHVKINVAEVLVICLPLNRPAVDNRVTESFHVDLA